MALIDYTTTDSVRAVLGVSEDEVEDVTLALQMYSDSLDLAMDGIDPDLQDTYTTVKAVDSPTKDQKRFLKQVTLYAAYQVASQCIAQLPMFAPILIQDGKGEQRRMLDPYEGLKVAIPAMMARLTSALVASLALVEPGFLAPDTSPLTLATFSTTAFDNVAGV